MKLIKLVAICWPIGNMARRFGTFWLMFAHQLTKLAHGEFHVECLDSIGPVIFGHHFGIVFVSRWCVTCGYRKPKEK